MTEWVRITITDPITWWERCQWLTENSEQYHDDTCWAGWQIGYNDIVIYVSERDAVNYYLRWA